jgi:hypothetical protein
MKVREALNRLQDWQLVDLVDFHHEQEESYSLEQFRQNLERLKEDFERKHSEERTKWDLSLEAKVSAAPSVGLTLKGQDITNAKWIQKTKRPVQKEVRRAGAANCSAKNNSSVGHGSESRHQGRSGSDLSAAESRNTKP